MREGVTNISSATTETTRLLLVNESYIETFDLELVEGRSFTRNLPEGERQWILNEEAVRLLFANEVDPIGKRLSWSRDTAESVGVVKNFNFETLHEEVSPLAICLIPEAMSFLSIRFEPRHTEDVLKGMSEVYATIYPNLPMIEPEFLDDRFETLYTAERKLQSLVFIFCAISIVLTISGIFALATYYTRRRAKEIAVRKLLGSSVADVLKLLSRHFIVMVGISLSVAIPLSYYLNNWWLAQFAYKVNAGILPYLIGSLGILLIVLSSSFYSTIKAALTNPVRWLRDG
jgi:putative ABC transport system permease protein